MTAADEGVAAPDRDETQEPFRPEATTAEGDHGLGPPVVRLARALAALAFTLAKIARARLSLALTATRPALEPCRRRAPGGPVRPHPLALAASPVLAALVAFGIAGYGLLQHGALVRVVQYDDGAYYAAAARLVEGYLPYRDFAFVQPPAIALLLAPVALVTHGLGTRVGLAVARVVTALVAGLCAYLAGALLRHRGLVASLVSGLVLACYPAAFFADRTVLLEPYLVVLCLSALRVGFPGGQLGDGRRMLLAGVLLGVAGTVKLWAVLPLAALALVALRRTRGPAGRSPVRTLGTPSLGAGGARGGLRHGVVPLVGGAAAGFGVVCLPFFAAAPSAFLHEVLLAQLERSPSHHHELVRVSVLTGLHGIAGVSHVLALARPVGICEATALATVALPPLLAGRAGRFEACCAVAFVLSLAAVLASPDFFDHYAYFPAAFGALVIGLAAGRGARLVRLAYRVVIGIARGHARPNEPARPRLGLALTGVVALAALVGTGWLAIGEARYAAASVVHSGDPASVIDAVIPPGACTVSDAPILLVSANRLASDRPGCPPVVDPTGAWLAISPTVPASGCGPVDPALVAVWRRWLSETTYVVRSTTFRARIPWTAGLARYFAANFRQISAGRAAVFVRRADPLPSGPAAHLAAAFPARSGRHTLACAFRPAAR